MSKAVKNIGSGITSQLTKQVKHKYKKNIGQLLATRSNTNNTCNSRYSRHLVFQFAEKAKQERVEQILSKLDKRIDNLGNEIDVEYIGKHIEEYAY